MIINGHGSNIDPVADRGLGGGGDSEHKNLTSKEKEGTTTAKKSHFQVPLGFQTEIIIFNFTFY